jgi:hypothetical protein
MKCPSTENENTLALCKLKATKNSAERKWHLLKRKALCSEMKITSTESNAHPAESNLPLLK